MRRGWKPAPPVPVHDGSEPSKRLWEVASPAGFEPATSSLEGCCSIHLSYGPVAAENDPADPEKTHEAGVLLKA